MADNTYAFITGFHFTVDVHDLGGTDIDSKFQEVSGISADLQLEELVEGGVNGYVHKLPKQTKFKNLILKRGLSSADSLLIKWAEKAVCDFDFKPHDVQVSLIKGGKEPIKSWLFKSAYPVKIEVSGFNAKENAIVIETLELTYQSFCSIEVPKNDEKVEKGEKREVGEKREKQTVKEEIKDIIDTI